MYYYNEISIFIYNFLWLFVHVCSYFSVEFIESKENMANNELRIPLQTPTTETTESSTFLKACFNGTNAFLGESEFTASFIV